MRRGEVWWADVRPKRRPVVVLTRDAVIGARTFVTVAPTTRRVRRIPTEVPLGKRDGMPQPCVVTLDDVRTIPKAILRRRITSLSAARLAEICDALVYAVGCSG